MVGERRVEERRRGVVDEAYAAWRAAPHAGALSETERDAEAFCCPHCKVVGVSVDEDGCCVMCGVDALIVTFAARLRSLPGGEPAPFASMTIPISDVRSARDGDTEVTTLHCPCGVVHVLDARVPVTESGEPGGARCYDCGLPYSDPGFADLVVPHMIWNERLSPQKNEGGLLCPTCMVRAAEKAGVYCDAVFRSGPFAPVTESGAPGEAHCPKHGWTSCPECEDESDAKDDVLHEELRKSMTDGGPVRVLGVTESGERDPGGAAALLDELDADQMWLVDYAKHEQSEWAHARMNRIAGRIRRVCALVPSNTGAPNDG